MKTKDAILQRRSVKHYDPDYVIDANIIDEILDLAAYSPSSFNLQHWRIVNVTDKALREQIKKAAWNQAQITDASHLLLICADSKANKNNPAYCWRDADPMIKTMMVDLIGKFYNNNPPLERDEALRSVGIIAQTLMLAVKSFGYDSCPMIGFDTNIIADLINLPENHIIGMMLTIGKAQSPANPRSGLIDKKLMLLENKFS